MFCYSLEFYFIFLLSMFGFTYTYSLWKVSRFSEKKIRLVFMPTFSKKSHLMRFIFKMFYIFTSASSFPTGSVVYLVNAHIIKDNVDFSFPIFIFLYFGSNNLKNDV